MTSRRRSSLLPRAPWPNGIERTEPLRGQLWTRSERSLRPPDAPLWRRGLAVVGAIVATSLLGWLWFGPALGVRSVEISGSRHLSASEIASAAGITVNGSVISIDDQAARQRLLDQVWIRSASVEPSLPGTVTIQVSEWVPVAVYHAGPSTHLFLLSSQAVVLGPTPASGGLVDIQGPAGNDPRPGDRALDPDLLVALVNMERAMPTLIGQDVAGFIFDSCGDLTMVAKRGWKVYFGRVLTPEEYASLRDKLTALKAIAPNVNYASSNLLYVNVMNPSEPAVGFKPKPPPVSASPSPSPSPSPTPTPSACK